MTTTRENRASSAKVDPSSGRVCDGPVRMVPRRFARSVHPVDTIVVRWPPLSLPLHAPVPPLLHDPSRRPGRCGDAIASTVAAGGLHAPARLGDLLAPAARQARQRPRRADRPRGAGPDRRPGDGDAGRPPGRHLEGQRAVPGDRSRARPLQGPQWPRHGPRDDPRGGRRPAPGRHREVVPPAPDAGLSLPDEMAGRAACPGRAHPRPRVRHEGRVQHRPRRRRTGQELLGSARGICADLRADGARHDRRELGRRDDGRQPRP